MPYEACEATGARERSADHARPLRMGTRCLWARQPARHYEPMQVFSGDLSTEYERAWYGRCCAYFASHPHIQRAAVRIEDRGHASTEDLPNRPPCPNTRFRRGCGTL